MKQTPQSESNVKNLITKKIISFDNKCKRSHRFTLLFWEENVYLPMVELLFGGCESYDLFKLLSKGSENIFFLIYLWCTSVPMLWCLFYVITSLHIQLFSRGPFFRILRRRRRRLIVAHCHACHNISPEFNYTLHYVNILKNIYNIFIFARENDDRSTRVAEAVRRQHNV